MAIVSSMLHKGRGRWVNAINEFNHKTNRNLTAEQLRKKYNAKMKKSATLNTQQAQPHVDGVTTLSPMTTSKKFIDHTLPLCIGDVDEWIKNINIVASQEEQKLTNSILDNVGEFLDYLMNSNEVEDTYFIDNLLATIDKLPPGMA